MLWAIMFIIRKLSRFALAAIVLIFAYVAINPPLWEPAKEFYMDEIQPIVVHVVDFVEQGRDALIELPNEIDI